MSRLTEDQRQHIIKLLQAGEELPPQYKHLLFPPAEEPHYELVHPATDDSPSPRKWSILVVDDYEDNRDMLSDQLEWAGYSTVCAENGVEALERLREQDLDLVLLDIMMPIMDGFQVLEAIQADPRLRRIPVVVISALQELDSVVRCIELGAEDYLFKPINPVLLHARVSASLEKKRLRDQEQAYLRRLEAERERSERLLLNILPAPVIERLKQQPETIADSFADVTVLFADIVNFT
ncbi:MAG TPA: response regulator, partial [Chloroflexi bacterium]|nr:response regulator [Chloroflexota bacterium]